MGSSAYECQLNDTQKYTLVYALHFKMPKAHHPSVGIRLCRGERHYFDVYGHDADRTTVDGADAANSFSVPKLYLLALNKYD